jgi:hypothetical protein
MTRDAREILQKALALSDNERAEESVHAASWLISQFGFTPKPSSLNLRLSGRIVLCATTSQSPKQGWRSWQ